MGFLNWWSGLFGGGGSSSTPIPTTNPDGTPNTGGVDIAGRPISGSAILPGVQNPLFPQLQQGFGQFLQSMVGQGATPYGGPLSPNLNSTILPNVYNSWQPWDSGMGYISNSLYGGSSPLANPGGYVAPTLQTLMAQGTPGGPGGDAMSSLLAYGVPGEGGSFAKNMAQYGFSDPMAGFGAKNLALYGFSNPDAGSLAKNLGLYGASSQSTGTHLANLAEYGVSGEQAGRPLSNLAYGIPDKTSANYLLPFLMGNAPGYRAPSIPAGAAPRYV